MKGFKDFIKDVLAIALIAGVCFGGYTLYKNYKVNEAKSDDSYKVLTNKDLSYDGLYTLTKLDEKGNNTWEGLTLTVEKDRIVSAGYQRYLCPYDELKKKTLKLAGLEPTEENLKNMDDVSFMIKYAHYTDKIMKEEYGVKFQGAEGNNVIDYKWGYEIPENIKLDEVNDVTTPFDKLKEYDLLPGFDEKSGEVWLSKLLKNEQSKFHEGYKLIKYDTYEDAMKAKIGVDEGALPNAEN